MAAEGSANGTKSALNTSIPAVHATSTANRRPAPATHSARPTSKKKSPDPRHLAIALHHAHNIQARKDTEGLILSRIEDLLSLPTSPTASASNPSTEDSTAFKSALRPFQPSDYDNLILERNIDGQCGYALCPKGHRVEDPKTQFRIMWGPKGSGPRGRGREMKVVPKEQIEKWCSDECAERAMYIRVQLIEEPAWERANDRGVDIVLLEEGRTQKHASENNGTKRNELPKGIEDDIGSKMRDLNLNGSTSSTDYDALKLAQQTQALDLSDNEPAVEGGNIPSPNQGNHASLFNVQEKHIDESTVAPPSFEEDAIYGGSIEGFEPCQDRTSREAKTEALDDVDEDDDLLACI